MSITACGRQEISDNVSAEIGMEISATATEYRVEMPSDDREDGEEISSADRESEAEMPSADREGETEMSSADREGEAEMPSADREGKTEMSSSDREDGAEMSSADCEGGEEMSSSDREGEAEMPSAVEDGAESTSVYASISEEVQADLGSGPLDIKLSEAIEENVILCDDTEIEACEWVDEERSCLRIRVQYKEPPPDNYQHKEDYFFFRQGEDIRALYVDYPTKDYDNMREDRYVWDACDFEAHLEDVTFDGREDLIIFLGHNGSHGVPVHGAYVYEDGFYRYKPGFEDIPDYEVDAEKQYIRGHSVDGPGYQEDYIFIYRNGDFEKVSYHFYEIGFEEY